MHENDCGTATSAVAAGYMNTQACLRCKKLAIGFEMGHSLPYVVQLKLQFVNGAIRLASMPTSLSEFYTPFKQS